MSLILTNIVNLLKNRFVLFGVFFASFVALHYIAFGYLLPSTETKDLWFYSGIFMVLFSILFIEPYYSSPKNVVTNAIPLLLVFLAIKTNLTNEVFWWFAMSVLVALIVLSITALSLVENDKSEDYWKNRVASRIKGVVVSIGQGKVLYSSVFIYFLLTYYSIQSFYTLTLFVLWFLILTIDPKSLHGSFSIKKPKHINDQIGEIFGVQSKKLFLVRIFEDKKSIKNFDLVKFRYSMQEDTSACITGIIFDTYFLNQEKWAKVLQLTEPQKIDNKLEINSVYKLSQEEVDQLDLNTNSIVGVVVEGSTIGMIKFEYSMKFDSLQEGDLLELKTAGKRLFYQVVGGTTQKESLEARNENGFIVGEAIQLGEWQVGEMSFQKFGWVPQVNTPVYKTIADDIEVEAFTYPNYELGKIPNTTLPSVIDLGQAISHHTALLGVTGSGKSFLAREIINQIKTDTKVICVDFNKEFISTLNPAPGNIIEDNVASQIATDIDWINNELEKFGNQQDKAGIITRQNLIKCCLKEQLILFINDNHVNVKVFELPDVSNTTGILDYTKYFFKVLFELAKERQMANNPVKICVVLEEAHTVIPEWNFAGSGDKNSQSLVNTIGQIALQGRKYGVGFLVIAQRTANVSKTVLTQCNTVICFQAYDETSFNFLGNYVGKDIVQALPNLKRFHAVVAGKAIKSNVPMIIDLTRK